MPRKHDTAQGKRLRGDKNKQGYGLLCPSPKWFDFSFLFTLLIWPDTGVCGIKKKKKKKAKKGKRERRGRKGEFLNANSTERMWHPPHIQNKLL